MPERPPLDDDQIIACLRADYALSVTDLEFLPLGYDSMAGVYRVEAGGAPYFLKVKRDAVHELSVWLPRYLKTHGIDQVVAPLPTVNGQLWGTVKPFILIIYPFIDGQDAWDSGLTDDQWIALGVILKRLHTTQLPPDLLQRVPRETFEPHPKLMATIKQIHADIRQRTYADPLQVQLAAFWRDHYDTISTVIDRSEQLGERLRNRMQAKPSDFALCHADIHLGNVLIDTQGALHVVDWDQPILAPRERDLMFVMVGGFVTDPQHEALFFRGYGETEIDRLVMAYYRYERTMQDLSEFAAQVFLVDTSDETKQDSIYWFRAQFAPGGLLEAAQRSL